MTISASHITFRFLLTEFWLVCETARRRTQNSCCFAQKRGREAVRASGGGQLTRWEGGVKLVVTKHCFLKFEILENIVKRSET